MELTYWHAVVLGIVEGLTEFLPVSSTGHLTIAEKLMGLDIANDAITGYTATIQLGAIVAAVIYFWRDIVRFFTAWVRGLTSEEGRQHHDYTLAWAVIVGSLPVGIAGLALHNVIKSPSLRNLTVVALALVLWSFVMWFAEMRHDRLLREGTVYGEDKVTVKQGMIIGLWQCISAVIPGISRSGATISGALMMGIDRVTATRLSFFLGIPALMAAGVFELKDVDFSVVPPGPMVVGLVLSFVVGYASIAWLLKFVATNSMRPFVAYRIVLGLVLLGLVYSGVLDSSMAT